MKSGNGQGKTSSYNTMQGREGQSSVGCCRDGSHRPVWPGVASVHASLKSV